MVAKNRQKNFKKIGGVEKKVEIDESVISKRKYNKGRVVKTKWILGGVCREDGNLFFSELPNRKMEIIEKEIRENVVNESIIITDSFKSYDNLKNLGFSHKKINHSIEFVSKENNEIHTQNIECRWSLLKKWLKNKGNNIKKDINSYLSEYIFRNNSKNK